MNADDLLPVALYALGALFCMASLLSLLAALWLLLKGDARIMIALAGPASGLRLRDKIFLGLVAVALLVALHNGAEGLLFWIPGDWGSIGEDGFKSYRGALSALFAALGGAMLIYIFTHLTADKVRLKAAEEELRWLRKIYDAKSFPAIMVVSLELSRRIDEFKEETPEILHVSGPAAHGLMTGVYDRLAAAIAERKQALAPGRA